MRIVFLRGASFVALVGVMLLIGTANTDAQTFSNIYAFGSLTNITGAYVKSPLVQAPDGTLYGVAPNAQGAVQGTVFKVQPDGTGFTVLKYFTNIVEGTSPVGGLVLSGNMLYGTAFSGGSNFSYGTVFAINTNGTGYTVLRDLNYATDGAQPCGGLLLSGGTLYGTTSVAGNSIYTSYGTVFKVNTNGTGFTVLKALIGTTQGGQPLGGLVLSGSTLYGTASIGGSNANKGTVFKVDTNGTGFAVLKSFTGSDGYFPSSRMVLSGGTLYGTTDFGGSSSNGTIFKIKTDGTGFAVMKNYTNTGGVVPHGELILSSGILYGSTVYDTSVVSQYSNGAYANYYSGYGTIYRIPTNSVNGSGYTAIKNFDATSGANPVVGMILSNDTLYGVTSFSTGGNSLFFSSATPPINYPFASYYANQNGGNIFKVNTNGSSYVVLKTLVSTAVFSDGANPYGSLVSGGGTLYGTTQFNDTTNQSFGEIFKVNADGTGFTVIKKFTTASSDGAHPLPPLVLSGNTLYGCTFQGGTSNSGTVFKVNTDGTGFAAVKNFSGGANGVSPNGGLALSGSTLYGNTYSGGSANGGTVFRVDTNGTGFAVLKSFSGSDGVGPSGRLALSGDTLYGSARYGGATTNSYGTAYKLNTNGTGFVVLKDFNSTDTNGIGPAGGFVVSSNTLYGTTGSTIFRVNTDGTGFQTLKVFTDFYQEIYPNGDLALSEGTLYGTTYYGGNNYAGAVYKVNTDGSSYTVLKRFNISDGDNPNGGVILSSGTLYGITYYGGPLNNGVVYKLVLAATPPSIITQPQSLTNLVTTSASFAVSATGSPPLSYQWWKGASLLNGETNTSYSIASVLTNDAGDYFAIVTNSSGSVTSGVATLTVLAFPPSITTQPLTVTNVVSTTAHFDVGAAGTAPLRYQWLKDSVAVLSATNTSLDIANVQTTNAGGYSAIITNNYGSVTSVVATLTVLTGVNTNAPGITGQPVSITNNAGTSASFTVTATGAAPLNYQWRKGGNALGGATSSTLGLSNVQTNDTGNYDVIVANNYGIATSSVAMLTVLGVPPSITTQPLDSTNNVGTGVSFSVGATGTAPLFYQWRKNASNIGGATSSSYNIVSVQTNDAATYSVLVSNSVSSVTSTGAVLTVLVQPPVITAQPQGLSVFLDSPAALSVMVTGTDPLNYQWRKDGTNLPGQTYPNFSLADVATNDSGGYDVIVANVSGSVTSTVASLTVLTPAGTNIVWSSSVDGKWNTAANWTPQLVPGPFDTATVGLGITVTLDTPVAVSNLTFASGTLAGNTVTVRGEMDWLGGTVNAPLQVGNGATLNWLAGNLNRPLTISAGGTMMLTNTTTVPFLANNNYGNSIITPLTVMNNGTVQWANQLYAFGAVTIYNNGLWLNTGDGTLTSYTDTNTFINNGTFVKNGGTSYSSIEWQFNTTGTVNTASGALEIKHFTGTNVLNGALALIATTRMDAPIDVASNAVLNWLSGYLDAPLTIDPGATLFLTNSATTVWIGYNNFANNTNNPVPLVNNGTVQWMGGTIYGGGAATIYNNGLWLSETNDSLVTYAGSNTFINTGTFIKTGGDGDTTISWLLNSTGIITVTNGTLKVAHWTGTNTLNDILNLNGDRLDAPITVTSNAVLNWLSGFLEAPLTIDPGATLFITNSSTALWIAYSNYANNTNNPVPLVNNGVVEWAGNLYGGGAATIYNNGLWQSFSDDTLVNYGGTNVFINNGALQKVGGSFDTYITWYLNSTGTITTASGALNVGHWIGTNTLNGLLNLHGNLNEVPLTVASGATLNWWSGFLDAPLTIASGATMTLTNVNSTYWFGYNNYANNTNNPVPLTNNGTVLWAGTIYGGGAATIYNNGLWQSTNDDTLISYAGSNTVVNTGLFQKSGGVGQTYLYWNFNNTGTLDAQHGIIDLAGSYTLTGGTFNVGINSLTTFGKINLSGVPTLAGNFSANLNDGYTPSNNNAFAVITFGSATGNFANYTLPQGFSWQVDYNPSDFTLTSLSTYNGSSVNDGVPDWWRQDFFGGTGLTTNHLSCATCDADGDGQNNIQEYLAGTDPTNSASAFRIVSITRQSNNLRVTWTTVDGKTNALQCVGGSYNTNSLTDIFIVTNTVAGVTNYLDVGAATNIPARYYRVRLVP